MIHRPHQVRHPLAQIVGSGGGVGGCGGTGDGRLGPEDVGVGASPTGKILQGTEAGVRHALDLLLQVAQPRQQRPGYARRGCHAEIQGHKLKQKLTVAPVRNLYFDMKLVHALSPAANSDSQASYSAKNRWVGVT